jgi:alkylation response protein AidB-like acyl-CoA dehydrogenase
MFKAFVSEMAMKLTTEVVQKIRRLWLFTGIPLERMMRDAKVTQIYTGTVEMQRIEIAEKILAE